MLLGHVYIRRLSLLKPNCDCGLSSLLPYAVGHRDQSRYSVERGHAGYEYEEVEGTGRHPGGWPPQQGRKTEHHTHEHTAANSGMCSESTDQVSAKEMTKGGTQTRAGIRDGTLMWPLGWQERRSDRDGGRQTRPLVLHVGCTLKSLGEI